MTPCGRKKGAKGFGRAAKPPRPPARDAARRHRMSRAGGRAGLALRPKPFAPFFYIHLYISSLHLCMPSFWACFARFRWVFSFWACFARFRWMPSFWTCFARFWWVFSFWACFARFWWVFSFWACFARFRWMLSMFAQSANRCIVLQRFFCFLG